MQQPQQSSTHAVSRASSQSSSMQMAHTSGTKSSGINPIFGKTSGWYHGAKYDTEDMWRAAEDRNNDTLKRCLKAGVNVNHSRWVKKDKLVGTGARSISDVVACRNDVKSMALLIEHGVDLSGAATATFASRTQIQRNWALTGDDRKLAEKDPWTTPLHLACRFGYIDMVRMILDQGHVDPNTRDSQSLTGIHTAVVGKGTVEILRLLVDRGAIIDTKDNADVTPLALAALFGKTKLVEQLLDHGAVIDALDSRGETALYNASLRNHYGIIKALAARGANIDVQNIDSISPFFKAASQLRIDCMNILMECGGNTDTRDKNGCTTLARATIAKNIPLITHLLQLGVDIDAEDSDGWTPLFVAMIHNDKELIHLLLSNGSSMRKTDNYHNTPLHQAAILGSTLVFRHMLTYHSNNLDYSQMNLFGETPLALASKHNNSPIVKILLKHGSNRHHFDPNGHRALDRAMYWGNYACVRLLLEGEAGVDSRALLALQQGKHDNPGNVQSYDMILNRLRSQYPALVLPPATTSSWLKDLFTRTITRESLCTRMLEKQGKPPLGVNPSISEKTDEEVVSPDPFEACIPKLPPSQVINNSTTNINANESTALAAGIIGTNAALGITNAVLGSL